MYIIYLRSGLIHNYSTKKRCYILVDGQPNLHLSFRPDKSIILNWGDVFEDFLSAKNSYYKKVLTSRRLQNVFQEKIKPQRALGVQVLLLANSITSTSNMISDDNL